MATTPSKQTWLRVIEQARNGDARHLLELLLMPTETDGPGNPMPGSFIDLPDDGELRLSIVSVLMFGPWRSADVNTVDKVMTRVFPPGKKPMLSEHVVAFADLHSKLHELGAFNGPVLTIQDGRVHEVEPGTSERHKVTTENIADSLGVDSQNLKRRIAKRRSK